MGSFADKVTLNTDEALDILAALEDAAAALEGSDHIELTFDLDGAARILVGKLTRGWA